MVYIMSGSRTAFGSYGGRFKDHSDLELGVTAVKGALTRANIEGKEVDEIIFGNVIQTTTRSPYLARHIGLLSGMTNESQALTVNRLCGSGLEAIVQGYKNILLGESAIVLAGGTENMSQAPQHIKGARFGSPNKAPIVEDMLWATLTDAYIGCGMGITAENLADQYNISREEQDTFAIHSHQKATQAQQSGRFAQEIVPFMYTDRKGKEHQIDQDEHIRAALDPNKIASLRPTFKQDGTVTAANASGINDGAAAVVLMSEAAAKTHHKQPLAKIIATAVVGVDPTIMGIGPAPATRAVIQKAGLHLDDIDLFEFNEAFAAQSLAVIKDLGVDANKVNVNGGAIALGHPLGASGARVTYSLAEELKLRNKRYGVASLCIGGGQGIAILLENETFNQ